MLHLSLIEAGRLGEKGANALASQRVNNRILQLTIADDHATAVGERPAGRLDLRLHAFAACGV